MYNINLKAASAESHVKTPRRVTCQTRERPERSSEWRPVLRDGTSCDARLHKHRTHSKPFLLVNIWRGCRGCWPL
jgi:hypothetical protein